MHSASAGPQLAEAISITDSAGMRIYEIRPKRLQFPRGVQDGHILAAPVVPPARAVFNQGDIVFAPHGRLLASTTGHNQIAFWNVADPAHATRIVTVPSESGYIQALAFSPRGNLLADVGYYGLH